MKVATVSRGKELKGKESRYQVQARKEKQLRKPRVLELDLATVTPVVTNTLWGTRECCSYEAGTSS